MARLIDGTNWPLPGEYDHASEQDLQWQLRYGEPTRRTLLQAAEMCAAYRALIADGTTKVQLSRLAALRVLYRNKKGT